MTGLCVSGKPSERRRHVYQGYSALSSFTLEEKEDGQELYNPAPGQTSTWVGGSWSLHNNLKKLCAVLHFPPPIISRKGLMKWGSSLDRSRIGLCGPAPTIPFFLCWVIRPLQQAAVAISGWNTRIWSNYDHGSQYSGRALINSPSGSDTTDDWLVHAENSSSVGDENNCAEYVIKLQSTCMLWGWEHQQRLNLSEYFYLFVFRSHSPRFSSMPTVTSLTTRTEPFQASPVPGGAVRGTPPTWRWQSQRTHFYTIIHLVMNWARGCGWKIYLIAGHTDQRSCSFLVYLMSPSRRSVTVQQRKKIHPINYKCSDNREAQHALST